MRLKPSEGMEPERHDAAQRTRLKLPDHIVEDSGKAKPVHGRSQAQGQVAPARTGNRAQAQA
jgi:hypothetical protein